MSLQLAASNALSNVHLQTQVQVNGTVSQIGCIWCMIYYLPRGSHCGVGDLEKEQCCCQALQAGWKEYDIRSRRQYSQGCGKFHSKAPKAYVQKGGSAQL